MPPFRNIPMDMIIYISEFIDPNPAVYTRLALVSRSFYIAFMRNSRWRLLNPYDMDIGPGYAIALKYVEDSNSNCFMGALWNLLNPDLWSLAARTSPDLPDVVTTEMLDFFSFFCIRESESMYAKMALILCDFGFEVYNQDSSWVGSHIMEIYPDRPLYNMVQRYLTEVMLNNDWLPPNPEFYDHSLELICDILESLNWESILKVLRRYGIVYKLLEHTDYDFRYRGRAYDHELTLAAIEGAPVRTDVDGGHLMHYLFPQAFANRRVVLEAASRVNALDFFCRRWEFGNGEINWLEDREFVLACVRFNGQQLLNQRIEHHWEDTDIVLSAIQQSPSLMENVDMFPRHVLNDRRVFLEFMGHYPNLLFKWDRRYLAHLEVVAAAAENSTRYPFEVFKDIAPELQTNPYIVMQVAGSAQANKFVLPYLHRRFLQDREVMLKMVENSLSDLIDAPEWVRHDRELVMAAAAADYMALANASLWLRDDPEVVFTAMMGTNDGRTNVEALAFASLRLRENREFMIRAINLDPQSYYYASLVLRYDLDVQFAAIRAAQPGAWYQYQQPGEGPMYTEFLERLARELGRVSEETPVHLRDDEETMLRAVTYEPLSLQFASHRLKCHYTVVTRAVEGDGDAFVLASEQMRAIILDEAIRKWSLNHQSEAKVSARGATISEIGYLLWFKRLKSDDLILSYDL